jgi:hypothetical protein
VIPPASLCAVASLLLLATAAAGPARDSSRSFLMNSFKMTSAEMDRADAGQVVSRTLNASDPREVATLGLVRIGVTPEFYVEQLTDIVNFKRDAAILQIGKFGNPPQAGDIADLTLEEWDVRKLRECRVGDCGLQLSAEAIERFRTGVDWQQADAEMQATRLMRQILVQYVTLYRHAGLGPSMQYADRGTPMDLGREFRALVDADVETWQHFAGLRRHLLEYPTAHVPETTDIIYWSKERVSRRLVVSMTHLAIARTADSATDYAIASKQIYGAHYFDASLGLTILLRDRSAPSPATYVVYINRSRVDIFSGVFAGIARKLVATKARSLVAEQLGQLQRSMERYSSDVHR